MNVPYTFHVDWPHWLEHLRNKGIKVGYLGFRDALRLTAEYPDEYAVFVAVRRMRGE